MLKVKKSILFLCCLFFFLSKPIFSQENAGLKPWVGELINGVCWAKSNVDTSGTFASTPEAYGMFYQWNSKKGWPVIDTIRDWEYREYPDRIKPWETINDPCPTGWRVPTYDEIKTLWDESNVTYICAPRNGINGASFISKVTDNAIFLPFAGIIHGYSGIRSSRNTKGLYWSSSEDDDSNNTRAMGLYLVSDFNHHMRVEKNYGLLIRCVADEKCDSIVSHDTVTICSTDFPYEWRDTTFGEGTQTGTYRISRRSCAYSDITYLHLTVQQENEKSCPGVFINGVCWAESNVDKPGTFAATPESSGMLYQWNRRKGWSVTGDVSGWDSSLPSGSCWDAVNDPCPVGWRVPTLKEAETLLDTFKVSCETISRNGVLGRSFTDISNNTTLFLPKSAYRSSSDGDLNPSFNQCYWLGTSSSNYFAYTFFYRTDIHVKNCGLSVRCVFGNPPDCGSIITDTSVSVCANALPYTWCDTTFDVGTESGVYRFQHISAVTGCDSIVNLHLTVHASDTSFFDAVCYGDDYNDYGFSLPVVYRDTILHDTLQSVWGCDSVRTLHLTVNPEYHTSLYDTVCRGASYNRYGFSLSDVQTDGDYTLSLSSQAGCDSILTLHLKVHSVYDTTLYDTICQGDSYSNYGFSLPSGTSGGTFINPYSTVHGCDSTVTLNLHVHPVYLFSATQNICQGDTFDFRGRKLYKSGVYYDSLTTVHGCDSIYCLTLSVHSVYGFSFSGSVCQGNGYHEYGFNLSAVTVDTIVRDTFKTRWGCDSIRTLYLTVHSVYDTTLYDTICQGDSYSNYGFSLPSGTSGGTFIKTYSTVHGCDSTVTLNLHVHPVYFFSETQHICQGDSISFRGRWLHTSGVYYDSLTTVHGCDSIYCLTLSVHSTSPLLFPDKVCYGSGYNKYGFSLPSVYHDTLVRDTFRSFWGCDSIRILSLSVQPVYDTPLYDTVCQGDGYYRHGFTLPSVQVDGVHTLTLSSRSGCDSTLILHLKVHPVYNTVLYDSICPSDYYERYGFRLSNLHESSTYLRTESTVHGCDSVVTLHLHVWPTYFYPETVHLCEGDTFDFRGMRYHESGEYYDSLTTTKGCDSIYCLYLSVHPVYDIQLSGVLCEGIPYTHGGFHVSTPGLHYQYLQSAFGCDSTVTLTLTEEKKIEGSIRVLLEDCSTHGYSFFFDPGDMINLWEWDLGDGTLLRSEECYHQYSDSGTYRIQLHAETYNECENHFSYVQRVPPYLREVLIHSDRQVIDEDYPTVHFRTEVFPGMRCLWDFGDGERGEGDRVSHTYNARTEKYYEVRLQVLNSDSCVTESRMDIEVVFLPKALNTFSPNGDGINDVFMPDYEIEIMDRNGLRIYSGDSGWDGTYNGRQAKEDTYFYRLHYRTANGKRQKTGYVTLIR